MKREPLRSHVVAVPPHGEARLGEFAVEPAHKWSSAPRVEVRAMSEAWAEGSCGGSCREGQGDRGRRCPEFLRRA